MWVPGLSWSRPVFRWVRTRNLRWGQGQEREPAAEEPAVHGALPTGACPCLTTFGLGTAELQGCGPGSQLTHT